MRSRFYFIFFPRNDLLRPTTVKRVALMLLCCCLLGGCGSWRLSQLWEKSEDGPSGPTQSLSRTAESACPLPQVTLAAPHVPESLLAVPSPDALQAEETADTSLPYTFSCSIPNIPTAVEYLQKNSLLARLESTPPPDRMGLDYRISKDEDEARSIMQSLGYYSATVQTSVEMDKEKAVVTMRVDPGPLYTVGTSTISYSGAVTEKAPKSLYDLGLAKDAPAVAETLLEAVDSVPHWLKTHGYPLAKVQSSHYYVDKEQHRLDAEIQIAQGPLARMGAVVLEGSDSVNPAFLQRMRPWKEGRIWNENRIEVFRNELMEQGLFRSISLEAVPAAAGSGTEDGQSQPQKQAQNRAQEVDTAPLYDILLRVADAPQRTVGGGLNYESDRGPGGQAFWEHRNFFGEGEQVRTELGLWQDRQNARFNFTKPAFLQRGQSFNAEAWLRVEDTDAYFQQAAWAGAGIERRLHRYWWASVKASAEGGELRDPVHKKQAYSMFGLPLGLRFDNTRSLLDSTSGMKFKLGVTPYEGQYGKSFSVLHSRLDGSAYLPLKDDNSVVLAARASVGSLWRDDALTVPASIRFYSGGGGSVRGYAYQSLGPRDSRDDPLGGASFLEMSIETRIKITKDIGIVPFLDGGNAFSDQLPRPDKEALRWGAGLGLRYYTSIGPLRLDVATPLNPRKDDAPFFVYISIGQSF